MPIKNLESSVADELRPEYDLASLKGGVRGKYHARATAGTTMVLLEPDVAEAFSDGASVNRALRSFLRAARGKLPEDQALHRLKLMANTRRQFAVCVRNDGYEASLELRKIYEVLSDSVAARHRQIRVIDESGEDYLFPASWFAAIELPAPIRRAVLAAV